jgi:putative heme iron utilization protein
MTSFAAVLSAYQTLPAEVSSLMLSTVSPEGIPQASYAPYVMDEAYHLYIFASGLSAHTQNLLHTPRAGVLLIQDEARAEQIFARRRITYDCQVHRLERQSAVWEERANALEQRFGQIIQMLRQLADFQLFQLIPQSGRFILGFGAAYEVDPNALNQLLPQVVKPTQG